MTDKELLELAAKAAGIEIKEWDMGAVPMIHGNTESGTLFRDLWNPLTDDSDALRLAVKLRLELGFPKEHCVWSFGTNGVVCMQDPSDDPYAATRRCIVRAAAAIGEYLDGNKNSRP